MEISCMVKRHVFVSVSKHVSFSFWLLCFLSVDDEFPERSLEVSFLNSEKMNLSLEETNEQILNWFEGREKIENSILAVAVVVE